MGIEVKNTIKVYEKSGVAIPPSDHQTRLVIHSHRNRRGMVVIQWINGQNITVAADDLDAAIRNARNKGE